MSDISFHLTTKEAALMKRITDRVEKTFSGTDRVGLYMDLSACHCNGNPLDLDKLLKADDFNFIHDISGIQGHINRTTGKLERCFLPRCSLPERKEPPKEQGRGLLL